MNVRSGSAVSNKDAHTSREIAAAVGISGRTVRRWINGELVPTSVAVGIHAAFESGELVPDRMPRLEYVDPTWEKLQTPDGRRQLRRSYWAADAGKRRLHPLNPMMEPQGSD